MEKNVIKNVRMEFLKKFHLKEEKILVVINYSHNDTDNGEKERKKRKFHSKKNQLRS